MLKVWTAMEPLDWRKAIKDWAPIMPVEVGLMAQAIQPFDLAGGATKAMERVELEGW